MRSAEPPLSQDRIERVACFGMGDDAARGGNTGRDHGGRRQQAVEDARWFLSTPFLLAQRLPGRTLPAGRTPIGRAAKKKIPCRARRSIGIFRTYCRVTTVRPALRLATKSGGHRPFSQPASAWPRRIFRVSAKVLGNRPDCRANLRDLILDRYPHTCSSINICLSILDTNVFTYLPSLAPDYDFGSSEL